MNETLQMTLKGVVQGLGIRPKIARLANHLGLSGWVRNRQACVEITASGPSNALLTFQKSLSENAADIQVQKKTYRAFSNFSIKPSDGHGPLSPTLAPDLATCQACLNEWQNPKDRRYQYPFISCAECGPRFSISKHLPFDRAHTSMHDFPRCSECELEFNHLEDRRYHAQTISCGTCGPTLSLVSSKIITQGNQAIELACQAIRNGQLLAVKGLGGFHLIAKATDEQAVSKCRLLKHRPAKPFALMVKNIEMARQLCALSPLEEQTLSQGQGFIVIAQRKASEFEISSNVAPDLERLGLMLPYTALHHALMKGISEPIVMTSLNLDGQPLIYKDDEAVAFLSPSKMISHHDGGSSSKGIEFVLTHNRDIVHPIDDSVVHCVADQVRFLRRARGGIPFHLDLPHKVSHRHLALGSYLKNTVSSLSNESLEVSCHIGNLSSIQTTQRRDAEAKRLLGGPPDHLIMDMHPEDVSITPFIYSQMGIQKVQHHHAHVFSVMAEHKLAPPLVGVAWDGTGYGLDSHVWGGETFFVERSQISRVCSLLPFLLPGVEKAIKEPKRVALSLLWQIYGDDFKYHLPTDLQAQFTQVELNTLVKMLTSSLNCSITTSVGRLFDGVSALLGLCYINEFEGLAAIQLEQCAWQANEPNGYPVHWLNQACKQLDWRPMIKYVLHDLNQQVSLSAIAAKFHQWLVSVLTDIHQFYPEYPLVLSGGVFQNKWLLEKALTALTPMTSIYTNAQVPCNDGGLSVGQAYLSVIYNALEENHVLSHTR